MPIPSKWKEYTRANKKRGSSRLIGCNNVKERMRPAVRLLQTDRYTSPFQFIQGSRFEVLRTHTFRWAAACWSMKHANGLRDSNI